jgi:hypothetical protein
MRKRQQELYGDDGKRVVVLEKEPRFRGAL